MKMGLHEIAKVGGFSLTALANKIGCTGQVMKNRKVYLLKIVRYHLRLFYTHFTLRPSEPYCLIGVRFLL